MIQRENTKELIDFEYDGKSYRMTPDEIEAAYRYQEMQYRRCDAESAVKMYVFGEDAESLDGDDYDEAVSLFESECGVKYADLMNRVPEIVGVFFQKHDCNVDENQTWSDAIEDVIARLKLQTKEAE